MSRRKIDVTEFLRQMWKQPRCLIVLVSIARLGRPALLKELVMLTYGDDQNLTRACKALETMGLLNRPSPHAGWGLTGLGKSLACALAPPATETITVPSSNVSLGIEDTPHAHKVPSQESVNSPHSHERASQKSVKSPHSQARASQKSVNSPHSQARASQKSVNSPKNKTVFVKKHKDLVVVNNLTTTNNKQDFHDEFEDQAEDEILPANDESDPFDEDETDEQDELDETDEQAGGTYEQYKKQADYQDNRRFFERIGILHNQRTEELARKIDPWKVRREWDRLQQTNSARPALLIHILSNPKLQMTPAEQAQEEARRRASYAEWKKR